MEDERHHGRSKESDEEDPHHVHDESKIAIESIQSPHKSMNFLDGNEDQKLSESYIWSDGHMLDQSQFGSLPPPSLVNSRRQDLSSS